MVSYAHWHLSMKSLILPPEPEDLHVPCAVDMLCLRHFSWDLGEKFPIQNRVYWTSRKEVNNFFLKFLWKLDWLLGSIKKTSTWKVKVTLGSCIFTWCWIVFCWDPGTWHYLLAFSADSCTSNHSEWTIILIYQLARHVGGIGFACQVIYLSYMANNLLLYYTSSTSRTCYIAWLCNMLCKIAILNMLGMSCPKWQWHRTGSSWSPVWTQPVAPLWCDLGFFQNSSGNKAAANLCPMYNLQYITWIIFLYKVQVYSCYIAVGLQFDPYRWRPCGVTWDSFRTVVVILLRRTSALTWIIWLCNLTLTYISMLHSTLDNLNLCYIVKVAYNSKFL